ncbi:MAG: hypothetical protein MSG64_13915 [Pyrinomonadaceae bacterium MAG19_C2-C3]|nr:hypothetical protein [Pyrinomonadaceae bacterium MAG19_C2-C3]
MLASLVLILLAVMSGAVFTYFYDDTNDETTRAVVVWRLAAGCATGMAWFALAGFIVASMIGMTWLAISITAALVVTPATLMLIVCPRLKTYMRRDARIMCGSNSNGGGWRNFVHRAVWCVVVFVLFLVCLNVYYERTSGIYTGFETNLGDMPFHVSIINGFAKGDNFPPQHTEFAGVPLTYPFLVDFVAAMFVRAGATMGDALLIENFALMLAFVVLLSTWGAEFVRSKFDKTGFDKEQHRGVGLVSVLLVLLSGGLGWAMFFRELYAGGLSNLFTLLGDLPHHYTITGSQFRWGNALVVLLVPQRSLLLGMPLFLIIVTLWWRVVRDSRNDVDLRLNSSHLKLNIAEPDKVSSTNRTEHEVKRSHRNKQRRTYKTHGKDVELKDSRSKGAGRVDTVDDAAWRWSPDTRRMLAAGVMTAMLPLIHAHCFLVVMGAAACLAVLFPVWRQWAIYFVPALMLASPQLVWAMSGSAVNTSDFIAWHVGWDSRTTNVFVFWFINAGLFLPLLIIALVFAVKNFGKGNAQDESNDWFASSRFVSSQAVLFYVPFGLLFIATNLLKLSPWVWDNIKMIFCWYVVSVPLVALLIVKAWERAGDATGMVRLASRVAVVAVFIVLTFAGTLDVWRAVSGAMPQQVFTAEARSFARVIEAQTAAQSLILHAPTYNHPTYLTGRRTLVGYPGHLWTHGLDYINRENEIKRIYANAPDRRALIAKYDVNYIAVGADERAAMTVDDTLFNDYKLVGEVGDYRLYEVKP